MNRTARMMLLSGNKNKDERRRRMGIEYEDWSPMDHYGPYMPPTYGGTGMEPESGFYDRRGRRHYDDGRYAPMRSAYGEPESRRDYTRYSDGRFAPRSEYNEPEMNGGMMSPSYNGGERRMNPIGFARDMGGTDATMPRYQEMDRMQGNRATQGYSGSELMPRFDRQMAEEWTQSMENEDGTRGPHWTLEQAKQVMAQKEIGGSPLEFWVAMNAMYSDYSKVAKKLGVNTVDFYACMAEAFLDDKDAMPDKLARYYEYVVRH